MTKIILAIAVFAFMASNIFAQNDGRIGFDFGVKTGANFANVYDAQGDEFRAEGKFGFVAGVFAAIPIAPFVGIQPEILFSQKGFKATGSLLGSNYGLTRTSNFIDIPLFLAVKPIPQITVLAGPQLSYLIRQTDEFNSHVLSTEQIQQFDNDNVRKNVVGAVAGLDFNLEPFVIGTRVGWDFHINNGDGSSQTPRYKNTWIQATLGYLFL
jgi:hypothetical protein